MRYRLKGLLDGGHNIKFFVVLPARRGLVYAAIPAFWHESKSRRRILVAAPLCFSYCSGLMATDNTSLTCRVHRLATLKFVALKIGTFSETICFGVVPEEW